MSDIPTERIILECDELDAKAIHAAIAWRQSIRILPDGGGNLAGRVIAEICRCCEECLSNERVRLQSRSITSKAIQEELAENMRKISEGDLPIADRRLQYLVVTRDALAKALERIEELESRP